MQKNARCNFWEFVTDSLAKTPTLACIGAVENSPQKRDIHQTRLPVLVFSNGRSDGRGKKVNSCKEKELDGGSKRDRALLLVDGTLACYIF